CCDRSYASVPPDRPPAPPASGQVSITERISSSRLLRLGKPRVALLKLHRRLLRSGSSRLAALILWRFIAQPALYEGYSPLSQRVATDACPCLSKRFPALGLLAAQFLAGPP